MGARILHLHCSFRSVGYGCCYVVEHFSTFIRYTTTAAAIVSMYYVENGADNLVRALPAAGWTFFILLATKGLFGANAQPPASASNEHLGRVL